MVIDTAVEQTEAQVAEDVGSLLESLSGGGTLEDQVMEEGGGEQSTEKQEEVVKEEVVEGDTNTGVVEDNDSVFSEGSPKVVKEDVVEDQVTAESTEELSDPVVAEPEEAFDPDKLLEQMQSLAQYQAPAPNQPQQQEQPVLQPQQFQQQPQAPVQEQPQPQYIPQQQVQPNQPMQANQPTQNVDGSIQFLSQEDHSRMYEDPTVINNAINSAYNTVVQQLLRSVPPVVFSQMQQYLQVKEAADEYYSHNKDMKLVKGAFTTRLNKVFAENPGMGLEEQMDIAGNDTRNEFSEVIKYMQSKGRTDLGVPKAEPVIETKPKFAGGTKGMTRKPAAPKPTGQQAHLEEMWDSLQKM